MFLTRPSSKTAQLVLLCWTKRPPQLRLELFTQHLIHWSRFRIIIQEKNAKRHYSRGFYTYLISLIMSNMDEHVLIQIYLSFNLCTPFYSLSNVMCYIIVFCMYIQIIYCFLV